MENQINKNMGDKMKTGMTKGGEPEISNPKSLYSGVVSY